MLCVRACAYTSTSQFTTASVSELLMLFAPLLSSAINVDDDDLIANEAYATCL